MGDGLGAGAGGGPVDGAAARQALWARYDAGELSAEELDARLRQVDRAGDDGAALARALDGPVRTRRSRHRLGMAAAGVLGVAVLVAGVVAVAGAVRGTDRNADLGPPQIGGAGGGTVVVGPPGVVVPLPAPIEPDCPALQDALEHFEGLDEETPPADPALLSDPAELPDGYALADEEPIVPGADGHIAMSVSAGNPAPVEILARELDGPLPVTMRAWVYESSEAAGQAGMDVLRQGVCAYAMETFEVPDRPEILGNVVSGVIPTTAFAGWRQGERRFSVAVEAGADDDPEATAAAQALAGEIASREFDAAATAPEPG